MKTLSQLLLILANGVLMTTIAFAGTKSAVMTVRTNVVAGCNISVMPLSFGNYDPFGSNKSVALDFVSIITEMCVKELSATVSIDQGKNRAPGSNPTNPLRRMQCSDGDGKYLNYSLYQDSAHKQVWGAGRNAKPIKTSGTAETFTVYGQIAPGQIAETGGFDDTVAVTVSY